MIFRPTPSNLLPFVHCNAKAVQGPGADGSSAYLFGMANVIPAVFPAGNSNGSDVVTRGNMICQSTSKTILSILSVDSAVTPSELTAMSKFLAGGCVLREGLHIVVEGDLTMSLSAAARFIGMSRDQFRLVADEMVDGVPRFSRKTVFGERHPRFYKIQLLAYGMPPPGPSQAGESGFKIAC